MTFTPDPSFDRETSNAKDWAFQLGNLPQNHHIVFTKAELVDFLKQLNVHVGPNFTELVRLPRYATIGRLSDDGAAPSQAASSASAAASHTAAQESSTARTASAARASEEARQANVVYTSSGEVFRPTRKVRELPGGGSAQITSLFGNVDEAGERPIKPPASRQAPAELDARREDAENIPPPAGRWTQPQSQIFAGAAAPAARESDDAIAPAAKYEGVPNDAKSHNGFRPTRRVRVPGGTGGASSIFFD